ncbi:nitroreductase/quinone reductase family protein [Blastococcus sp. CT_GayMR16]|uniref:nitroreductase/quinone reductase family protein n=1 Tax=Blastococcus sp. CT_GayMR16 TaxID=2559607 RepID=UPI001073C8B3|nr:nitroreductase/quinone reductase family protein [Blastococcus sp. CT_GayMR16]TFV85864.1 DUF385 domain-containing protein [Blastococcus sp. CT_GayMR16]
MATSSGFWLTNRFANPVLRRLLRTSAGARLGRGLMVVRYTGTVTGRPRELVVQYARDGDTVWVLVGQADRKTWWHNLRQPADVDLWLAGKHVRARAVVVAGDAEPERAASALAAYMRAVPRAAAALGLPAADERIPPDAVRTVTLVRADLAGRT